MSAELSHELAAERGILHGGWMTIQTASGRIEARAMVDAAAAAFWHRGARGAQDRPPLPLGFRWGGRRQQRQRTDRALGRPEREHARKQGVRLPSPCRAAPREAPTWRVEKWNCPRWSRSAIRPAARCWSWWDARPIRSSMVNRRSPNRLPAFSRIPPYASAARLARWRASSGTNCPRMAFIGPAIATTIRRSYRRQPGAL